MYEGDKLFDCEGEEMPLPEQDEENDQIEHGESDDEVEAIPNMDRMT